MALLNLSICYTWKNIRKQYRNNKLQTRAPAWNNKFELPNGPYSVSDIQDYIEFVIKKYKTLTTISPIHVHINIIINRLVFKVVLSHSKKVFFLFASMITLQK